MSDSAKKPAHERLYEFEAGAFVTVAVKAPNKTQALAKFKKVVETVHIIKDEQFSDDGEQITFTVDDGEPDLISIDGEEG